MDCFSFDFGIIGKAIELLEQIIELLEQRNEACDPPGFSHLVPFRESEGLELLELIISALLMKLLMLHVS